VMSSLAAAEKLINASYNCDSEFLRR
jgi:hypothetical protein